MLRPISRFLEALRAEVRVFVANSSDGAFLNLYFNRVTKSMPHVTRGTIYSMPQKTQISRISLELMTLPVVGILPTAPDYSFFLAFKCIRCTKR